MIDSHYVRQRSLLQRNTDELERMVRLEPGLKLAFLAMAFSECTEEWSDILGWNLAIAGVISRGNIGATAELNGCVAALWQRLGDLLGIIDGIGGFQFPEDQVKIRNARALHALFKGDDHASNQRDGSDRPAAVDGPGGRRDSQPGGRR